MRSEPQNTGLAFEVLTPKLSCLIRANIWDDLSVWTQDIGKPSEVQHFAFVHLKG